MKRIILTLLVISPFVLSAQTPQWIWPDRAEKTETVYFRKVVELPAGKIKSAKLQATCDNGFSLFVNGKPALAGDNWNRNGISRLHKLWFMTMKLWLKKVEQRITTLPLTQGLEQRGKNLISMIVDGRQAC